MRKFGFTLAEVLITLGIIGVVAAMTMPVLINNVRNKQLETAFKGAYSILSQAVQQVANDEGGNLKKLISFSQIQVIGIHHKSYSMKIFIQN